MLLPVRNVHDVLFSWDSGAGELTISWIGVGTSYDVRYRTAATDWSGVLNTVVPSIVIPGLTISDQYEFEIKTRFGSAATLPDYYGFCPPSGETRPSNLQFTAIGTTFASILWSGPSPATYVVSWQDETDNFVESVILENLTSYVIRNLQPGRNYKIFVTRYILDEALPAEGYLDLTEKCCILPTAAWAVEPPV